MSLAYISYMHITLKLRNLCAFVCYSPRFKHPFQLPNSQILWLSLPFPLPFFFKPHVHPKIRYSNKQAIIIAPFYPSEHLLSITLIQSNSTKCFRIQYLLSILLHLTKPTLWKELHWSIVFLHLHSQHPIQTCATTSTLLTWSPLWALSISEFTIWDPTTWVISPSFYRFHDVDNSLKYKCSLLPKYCYSLIGMQHHG